MHITDYEIQLEIEKHRQETGGTLGEMQARAQIQQRRTMSGRHVRRQYRDC